MRAGPDISDQSKSGRERLLAAAAAAFSDSGYAGTSIARIAREGHMSKSTVFHHFPSKEALYLAVIEDAVNDFGQRLDGVLAQAGGLHAALLAFQGEHLRHLRRHRQVGRLILRELQDPALRGKRGMILELLATNVGRLAGYLREARRQGQVRDSVQTEIAALVLFAANAFFFQHADELAETTGLPFESDPDRFASSVIDLVFNGLAPRGGTENAS